MTELLTLVLGLLAGGVIIFLLMNRRKTTVQTAVQSHTILEKIEKVFKVVLVEGYFSEIYDYKQTEKIFYLFNTTKKALLIVNAKVMMGYDFKKLKLEVDDRTKEVTLLEFPEPEILSTDPEVRYYNVEENLLNKFSTTELTHIQQEAKNIIIEKAMQSDLPQIARNQIRNLLLEVGELKNWKLKGVDKLLISQMPKEIAVKQIP